MTLVALDTSAAIPLLMRSHQAHDVVRQGLRGFSTCLTDHSLAETFSVLTRLPGDARLTGPDAARLIAANFEPPVRLSTASAQSLPEVLAALGILGGAVYDALVALAAKDAGVELVTRDARAAGTYASVGVRARVIS